VPIPIPEALAAHEDLAVAKAAQARSSMGRYLLSSMLAGAYVGVAVVLLIMVSAPLVAAQHPFTKLVQGSVFGIALTLVVFAGAELFTGNNMILLQGFLRRRVQPADVVLVWLASLVGNFLGSVAFAKLVDGSGILTTGAPPGQPTAFQSALGAIALAKHNLTGGQLFLRSVLCNMLVCLALWMAARAASDAAKLVVLWWALLAFIASGFEHSVANMTSLSLAAMTDVGTWGDLARNLLYTVPGNLVGGGVFVGLAYGWLGRPAAAPALAAAAEVDGTADVEPDVEPDLEIVVPARPARTAAKKAPAKRTVPATTKKAAPRKVAATNGRTR
jgi:nitrite transporter NirC